MQHGISNRGDKADIEVAFKEVISFEGNTGVFASKLCKVREVADSFMMN